MGLTKVTKETIHGYADASSIHGIVYIFDVEQPVIHRLIWLGVVLAFLALACISNYQAYVEWRENPVVTSLESISVPINEIEFPSITICPKGAKSMAAIETIQYQLKKIRQKNGEDVDFLFDLFESYGIGSNMTIFDMKDLYNELYPGFMNENVHPIAYLNYIEMVTSLYRVTNPSDVQDIRVMAYESDEEADEPDMFDDCNLDFYGLINKTDFCPGESQVVPAHMEYFDKGDCIYITEESTFDNDICLSMGGHSLTSNAYNVAKDYLHFILSSNDSIRNSYFWMDTFHNQQHNSVAFFGPGDEEGTFGKKDHLLTSYPSNQLFIEEEDSNLTKMLEEHKDDYDEDLTRLGLMAKVNFKGKGFDFRVARAKEKARYICHFPVPWCVVKYHWDNTREYRMNDIKKEPETSLNYYFAHRRFKQKEAMRKSVFKRQKQIVKRLNDNKIIKENLLEQLWFSMTPCFESKLSFTESMTQTQATILECTWKGTKLPCHKIFTPVPTDQGVCCSFNLEETEKFYRTEIDRIQNLLRLQNETMKYAYSVNDVAMDPNWRKEGYEPISQSGIGNGLTLLIDTGSNLLSPHSLQDDFQGLLTIIDQPNQYPHIERKAFLIDAAHETFVTMDAAQIEAEEEIREYTPEDRGCYFADEYQLRVHKQYTKNNCRRECLLQKAMDAMRRETESEPCLPWYYPAMENKTAICDPWEAETFFQTLQREEIKPDQCPHCLDDCTETFYSSELTATPFEECNDKNMGLSQLCPLPPKLGPIKYLQGVLEEYGYDMLVPVDWEYLPPSPRIPLLGEPMVDSMATHLDGPIRFPSKPHWVLYEPLDVLLYDLVFPRSAEKKRYDAYETDMLRVHFSFGSDKVTKFKRKVAMSNVGFVSQVGGLAGLFMGFSFLSGVEIVFWAVFKWNQKRMETAKGKA